MSRKAFFLPVVMAFVIGTMLSPAASFLERYRIPRAVGAVLIVADGYRSRGVHGRADLLTPGGMEHTAAGSRRTAEGQAACVRPADRAVAGAANHDGRLQTRSADFQMPKVDWVQPTLEFLIADLHRIPAVLRDADPVHRELARPAPRLDPDLRRSRCAPAHAAHPQRNRGASRQLSADRHDDQYRRRDRDRHRLLRSRTCPIRRASARWPRP